MDPMGLWVIWCLLVSESQNGRQNNALCGISWISWYLILFCLTYMFVKSLAKHPWKLTWNPKMKVWSRILKLHAAGLKPSGCGEWLLLGHTGLQPLPWNTDRWIVHAQMSWGEEKRHGGRNNLSVFVYLTDFPMGRYRWSLQLASMDSLSWLILVSWRVPLMSFMWLAKPWELSKKRRGYAMGWQSPIPKIGKLWKTAMINAVLTVPKSWHLQGCATTILPMFLVILVFLKAANSSCWWVVYMTFGMCGFGNGGSEGSISIVDKFDGPKTYLKW